MKLYTRPGSPRLYADLIHPGTGKRVRFSTGETERRAATKAALSHLQALQREADAGRDGHPAITLNDALNRYVAKVATKASGASLLSLALKSTGRHPTITGRHTLDGNRWLHELTTADVDRLVTARQAEGMGPQTIAHELKVLRTATRNAAELGFRVPDQIAWRMPEITRKTRYLSLEEYRQVFDYMDPDKPICPATPSGGMGTAYVPTGQRRAERRDAQDVLVALAMTGGRWNEVAGMTWGQVDLSEGLIRLWGEKTNSERLVPIPEPARAMLQRRLDAARKAGAVPASRLVFPGRGGARRGPSSCQPILRAMEACGLNNPESVARHGKATVHSLRHTFASLLLQNGAELSEVQEALGHATLDMTRRYAHLAKRQSAHRLGALLTQVASRDVEAMESAPGGTSQPAPG